MRVNVAARGGDYISLQLHLAVLPMPLSMTPFLVAPAAEAWDASVRWREDGQLRDLTVEASWQRVAAALGQVDASADFARRCFDALLDWRLLLDPRILASAGTGRTEWPADGLVAALNLSAFVRRPLAQPGWLDLDEIRSAAALAVQALDNASLLAGSANDGGALQIGLIGVADALLLLGIDYRSADAAIRLAEVATCVASGATEASLQLGATRGARVAADRSRLQRLAAACDRFDPALATGTTGLRWRRLTRIQRLPLLAQLANNASDALDPLASPLGAGSFAAVSRADLANAAQAGGVATSLPTASVADQLRLRAAVAPWVDAPIDYPLVADAEPESATVSEWCDEAQRLGLPTPQWHLRAGASAAPASRRHRPGRQPALL